MRTALRICVLGSMLICATIGASPVGAESDMTVGGFLVSLAHTQYLDTEEPARAEAALRALGMSLPPLDLDRALTEGDVATIAAAAGLEVRTTDPDRPFTASQAASFLASYGSVIHQTRGDGAPEFIPIPDPPSKKQKRKKRKSPKDPD